MLFECVTRNCAFDLAAADQTPWRRVARLTRRIEVLWMQRQPVRLRRSFHRRRFHRSSKQCAVEERIVQFHDLVVAQ